MFFQPAIYWNTLYYNSSAVSNHSTDLVTSYSMQTGLTSQNLSLCSLSVSAEFWVQANHSLGGPVQQKQFNLNENRHRRKKLIVKSDKIAWA